MSTFKLYSRAHLLSCVQLLVTFWAVTHQGPLSMEFFRQKYWSGLHFLLQGIFLDQGLNPDLLHLPHWQTTSLPLSHQGKPVNVVQSLGHVLFFCNPMDYSLTGSSVHFQIFSTVLLTMLLYCILLSCDLFYTWEFVLFYLLHQFCPPAPPSLQF